MKITKFVNHPEKGGSTECWICMERLHDDATVFGCDISDHVCCSKECAQRDHEEVTELAGGK